MPDLEGDNQRLREVVSDLRLTVATLNGTVEALARAIDRTVTLDRFQAVKDDVDGLIKLRDWAVNLVLGAVILALLALVIRSGT